MRHLWESMPGLVVAQADLREAVERLHQEFFTDVDPEVFE